MILEYLNVNKLIILCVALFMGGCTIFSPQDQLHPSLTDEIPDEYLNESVNIVSPISINYWCMRNGLDPIISILTPFTLFGCYNLYHPDKNGIYKCVIYQAYDADWIYVHEHRHCKGYVD